MKITIVMGFFLPMPPTCGGATEKSWFGLAGEFARRGHQVTMIARQLPSSAADERIEGVRFLRLPGHDHRQSLLANLWHDLRWSARVHRMLPEADLTIVNCVALPLLLRWSRRATRRIAVMTGRMPKGQYRFYGHVDRVLAVSSAAKDAVAKENPKLSAVVKVCGYPIAWSELALPRTAPPGATITIGYVGRLHREKGLDLLVSALSLLATRSDLPPWRVLICGPSDIPHGGSGEAYLAQLEQALAARLPRERFRFVAPVFDPADLAAIYREIDVFCYPSLAARGETFGVAVAEAMAAGAVPVVSRLPCFTDFVVEGKSGITFDHAAPDAPAQLADAFAGLLRDDARRHRLSVAAQEATRIYNFPAFAERLLADFSTLK